MLALRLDLARRPYEQDAPLAGMPRQVLQEIQAGAIRPVEVIEQEDDRRLFGERLEEPDHLPEEPLLGAAIIQLKWRLAALEVARRAIGQETSHLGPLLCQTRLPSVCAGLGQNKRLQEGVPGDGLLWLIAAPGDDAEALRARLERDLLREAGFADAWVPHEHEQLSLPAYHGVERGVDQVELALAPHQWPSWRRPQEGADGRAPGPGNAFSAPVER